MLAWSTFREGVNGAAMGMTMGGAFSMAGEAFSLASSSTPNMIWFPAYESSGNNFGANVRALTDEILDFSQSIVDDAAKGLQRAGQYSEYWQQSPLSETIQRIAGDNPIITATETGKILYKNSTSGIQVVYDKAGNYFRVQNLNVTGRATNTDLYGNALPNNVPLIKSTGTTQTRLPKDIWKALTHFLNID